MAGKTLVAYASKGGATEEIAKEIAGVLKEKHKLAVDVVNLRKDRKYDLSGYSNIVAGSGVRMGRIYGSFWKLIEKDISEKKLAFFIVCGEAIDTNDHKRVLDKHSKSVLNRNPRMKPVDFEVFGGCMKMLWKVVSDGRDPVKVRAWADKLGKKLK